MEGEFTPKEAEKWRDGEDSVGRMQMTDTRGNKVPSEGRSPTSVIPNTREHVWIKLEKREN